MEFIETTKNEANKDAWLEKRKHYVTGTDAGKLIGVSPYGGKFAVWLDKMGRAAPVVETPAMKAGKKFESAILQTYAEEMNCKLEHVDGYQLITCDKGRPSTAGTTTCKFRSMQKISSGKTRSGATHGRTSSRNTTRPSSRSR